MAEYSLVEAARGPRDISDIPPLETREPHLITEQFSVFYGEHEAVKTVDNLTLADGKVIAFNGRETPTRGRELTVLEQLIGSIGAGGLLPRDEEGVPGSRPGDRR